MISLKKQNPRSEAPLRPFDQKHPGQRPIRIATPGASGMDHRSARGRATGRKAARNDNRASDELLDQYYTRPDLALYYFRVFSRFYDPSKFQMVEPSGGDGAFFGILPAGSLGFDCEPKYPGIATADFLTLQLRATKRLAFIGNPPFGRNSSMAVRFFNHAASQGWIIAFILPRTFRKASIQNRLHTAFHMVAEEQVPANAFLFRGKPFNVPATFQIWERRDQPRERQRSETRHPDFEFTTRRQEADFAIQRVGAQAGRVHKNMQASLSSHLFIKGQVEKIMRRLDLRAVAANVSGNPSVCKSEIVRLYREYMEASCGRAT